MESGAFWRFGTPVFLCGFGSVRLRYSGALAPDVDRRASAHGIRGLLAFWDFRFSMRVRQRAVALQWCTRAGC